MSEENRKELRHIYENLQSARRLWKDQGREVWAWDEISHATDRLRVLIGAVASEAQANS